MAQLANMHQINRLIEICLDIADYYDKKARDDEAENLYPEDKAKIKAFVKTLFDDIDEPIKG